MMSASPATNPPTEARDLLNVPMIRSTWSVRPKWLQVPLPLLAEHPDAVGVVDHHHGVVLLGQFDDFGQLGDVAFHRENAVDDDELVGVLLALENQLQVLHVVVAVFAHVGEGKAGAVDDRGVVGAVDDDGLIAAGQGAEDALVDHEPGRKYKGLFLADQAASFSSSSMWMSRVPLRNREPAQPVPYLAMASWAASLTLGWLVSPR